MVKYGEILRLRAMGASIRNIAFSCRCSTATVRAVTGRAKAAGIKWPLPEEMGDRAIREVIYPPKSKADPDKAPIDHDHVDAEMSRPGVTMMLLWSELRVCGQPRQIPLHVLGVLREAPLLYEVVRFRSRWVGRRGGSGKGDEVPNRRGRGTRPQLPAHEGNR